MNELVEKSDKKITKNIEIQIFDNFFSSYFFMVRMKLWEALGLICDDSDHLDFWGSDFSKIG